MTTDKVCDCQFCKDHKWLVNELLPAVPEQHRKRLEEFFSWAWQVDEELCYKKAILDGSWPEAVIHLKLALANAEKRLAKEEQELKFDCKVCDKCSKAMTAKEYWEHKCDEPGLVTKEVVDPPMTENNLPNYEEEMDEDPYYGGDHQQDFF